MKLPHWLVHDWDKWTQTEAGQITQSFYHGGTQVGKSRVIGTYFEQVRSCKTCGFKQARTIKTKL